VKAHQDDKRPYRELDVWGRLNCDADGLAEKFRALMDMGDVKMVKEGFFSNSIGVGIKVGGVRITSHVLHKIRLNIQGRKHQKYLQDKHDWDTQTWNSIDKKALKSSFLSLGPLKWIKTSKSIHHGWLNTGRQKSKISPDAVDSHKCPRCHKSNETHEHVLTCPHVGAHKKRYDLMHPMMRKIIKDDLCPVQQVFATCIRTWLKSPETLPKPDVSIVPEAQRDILIQALNE
jgi:hypothetical protein